VFIILTVQLVERTRDLGVLQALGSPPRGVTGIYLRIGAGICSGGIILGTIVGVLFCSGIDLVQRWVFVLTGFQLFPKDIYYIETIPVRLLASDYTFVILPTVLAGFLASYLATYRAARKDPVEALRYE
jgi:lipoprotein-releasing system permease protein